LLGNAADEKSHIRGVLLIGDNAKRKGGEAGEACQRVKRERIKGAAGEILTSAPGTRTKKMVRKFHGREEHCKRAKRRI